MGVPSVRRAREAALLVGLLLASVPTGAAASDGEAVLAESSVWSLAADLDDDGTREVVIVKRGGEDSDGEHIYVAEAWGFRDGGWVELGSAPILRWEGGDDPGVRPARSNGRDALGLIVLERAGAPLVLAASSIVESSERQSTGCCLSLARIELHGGDRLVVEPFEDDYGPVESLSVLDVDADGTDELFVTEQTSWGDAGPPASTYALLRQVGGGFEREPIALPEVDAVYWAVAGETDGVVGDDLVFLGQQETVVLRVADHDGALRVERADAQGLFDWEYGGWFAGVADGALLTVEQRGASLYRWPRDRAPVRIGGIETSEFPSVMVLGSGPDARLVELAGTSGMQSEPLGLRIYDRDMRLERYLPAPELLNRVWAMGTEYSGPPVEPFGFIYPQVGPVPGGIGGRPALLGYGSLVVIESDGSLRLEDAAPLVSVGFMGVVGPDDGWLLTGPMWYGGTGESAYLGSYAEEPAYSSVRVVPLAAVLDPSANQPSIVVEGATEVGTGVNRRLVAPDGGFQVTVDGPPGTVVVVSTGRLMDAEEITNGPVTMTLDPGGQSDRNRSFEASVVVVRPTGIASGARWNAEILREAPEVTVHRSADAFSLSATIFGRASAGAEVTVDGVPVETNRNGAYRIEVDAPIWPRDVMVVARDPVGHETVERIEIIGFIDYRGLPWIPIIAVLTVVAGIVLFVRTPRLRPEERLRPDGDGRLEEIDGDLI